MKNGKLYIRLFIVCALIMVFMMGCGKNSPVKTDNEQPETTTVEPAPAETSEAPVIDPQADFIAGAKTLLSTDLTALLTEKEDEAALVGMLSDFLYDLNNITAQTNLTVTLSDIVAGGDALGDEIFLSLDAFHDAASGDSSMELSVGLGSENARKAGIYVTGDSAVLKPGSTESKIMLYTMPSVPDASNTFMDKASILFTGLLSEDGKPYTLGSNLTDRQELCARYLDPWLTDTKQEEYTDEEVTKTLCGKDVPLRAVTLDMTGQRAYDFVLGNLEKLQADAQFADTDKLLGGIMGLFSTDLYDMVTSLTGEGGAPVIESDSAVGKLVTELQALTDAEKAAASFTVSLYFNGEKPTGIYIEAATTGKAFQLGALLYRSGLEHQLNLYYKYLDGTTANVTLSTVGTGGDNYDANGTFQVTDNMGLQVLSGGYTGKLVETAAKYDLTGDINLTLQIKDEEGVSKTGTVGGKLTLGITHDDTGYTGQGMLDIALSSPGEEGLSAKIQLDAKLILQDSVTITPPMYTSANSVTVTGRQDLVNLHQEELAEYADKGKFIQDIIMMMSFIIK
jgi:hypothetical protein